MRTSLKPVHRRIVPVIVLGVLCALGSGSLGSGLLAQVPTAADPSAVAERECDDFAPFRAPYFGDLHVHTSYSMDTIYFQGNRESDPAAAYRFAQGEPIGFPPIGPSGQPAFTVQLDRPLDFAAVTDHAEYLGETRICFTPGHPGYDSPECELLRGPNAFQAFQEWFGPLTAPIASVPDRFDLCQADPDCLEVAGSVWQETQAAANAADDPTAACEFSTFVGYEWTGSPGGANLHRNVLFAGDVVPDLPVSYLDEPRPEKLLESIESECLDSGTGCDAVIVPHNSNLSLGRMFSPTLSDGTPFSAADADRFARLQPLMEIVQHKGVSECHPALNANDELCSFGILANPSIAPIPGPPPPVSPFSFARGALKEGLAQRQSLGTNPFELGFVGGTDDHNAAAGFVDEEEYSGHLGALDSVLPGRLFQVDANPGGLTVIWAEENSRRSLFDALSRREVYATSGPRPVVRFFGGFGLPAAMCGEPAFAPLGYAHGVPMGGVLNAPEAGESLSGAQQTVPRFAVSALQDPGTASEPGAPLERIQVIKGWIDDQGTTQETVYDVAGSEGDAGSPSLCTVWTDPDFDAGQAAFYYARVLQTPTPRWHAIQCDAAGISCEDPDAVPPPFAPCCDPDIPREIQERAWTSPIWYYPDAG